LFRDIVLFAVLFIIGLYHLFLYLFRPKDISPLYFSLICGFMALRVALTGEEFLLTLWPGLVWGFKLRVEYLTFFIAPPLFALFLHSLYPLDIPRWFVRLFLGLGLAFSALALSLNTLTLSYTPPLYQMILLVQIVIYIPLLGRLALNKREGAGLIITACVVVLVTVILDVLDYQHIIPLGGTSPWGFLTFIFIQAILLAQRSAKAFHLVEAMSERLRTLDRLKDQFLANTSHELRTPINGIIGLAQSLIDGATGRLPRTTSDNLRLIVTSGKRLANLVNDILDFSRLKHHDLTLQSKALDMRTLTEVVLTLSQPLLAGKDLRLINRIPPETPPVLADENRVQQIMHNLVGNALKFTPSGSISVEAASSPNEVGFLTVRVQGYTRQPS
jgi:two-component system sensor histidine kinase ChiS